jgi:hypothetical protein
MVLIISPRSFFLPILEEEIPKNGILTMEEKSGVFEVE